MVTDSFQLYFQTQCEHVLEWFLNVLDQEIEIAGSLFEKILTIEELFILLQVSSMYLRILEVF
jgi:hypothetical protein